MVIFCLIGTALPCLSEDLYNVREKMHIKSCKALENLTGYERYTPICIICVFVQSWLCNTSSPEETNPSSGIAMGRIGVSSMYS